MLGALDLLAAQDRLRLVPALILYHPSKLIVLRALTFLAAERRQDFVPIADRLLAEHADAEVRAAALRARWVVKPDEGILLAYLNGKGFAELRATALVTLVSRGSLLGEEARRETASFVSGSRDVRLAFANAIALEPAAGFDDALLSLAKDADPEVRIAAATAMGRVASPRFVTTLIEMLAGRREASAAGTALSEMGEQAFAALDRVIADRGVRIELRWGAARALGRIGGVRAAQALAKHLVAFAGEPMLAGRIARALTTLRANDPQVAIDGAALSGVRDETIRVAFRSLAARLALEAAVPGGDPRRTPVFELLITMLRDDEGDAVARMCLLLGLLHPRESFLHIERGLRARSARTRSSSRELIEGVVASPLREAVLAIVDDAPDAERLARGGSWGQRLGTDVVEILRMLSARGGEISSLARCYATEVGLPVVDEAAAAPGFGFESVLSEGLAAHACELIAAREAKDAP